MNDKIIYLRMSVKMFLNRPGPRALNTAVRYYGRWNDHLKEGSNSMSDRMAWLTFPSITEIKRILKSDMIVFEYGSGGSTLFWSDRVKKVVSVEHNREWHSRVKEELVKQKIGNVDYFIIEAEADPEFSQKAVDDPQGYISNDKSFSGKKFESYVKKIDEYPDNYFDIVLIDGRARPSCILHALKKVKENGYIILDNSERDYYLRRDQLDKQIWKRVDYPGPAPYIRHFTQTTLFKKLSQIKTF